MKIRFVSLAKAFPASRGCLRGGDGGSSDALDERLVFSGRRHRLESAEGSIDPFSPWLACGWANSALPAAFRFLPTRTRTQ